MDKNYFREIPKVDYILEDEKIKKLINIYSINFVIIEKISLVLLLNNCLKVTYDANAFLLSLIIPHLYILPTYL